MKKIEYDYAEWYNNDSNIAVWFIEGEQVGVRLQQHGWKEGDKVLNDGRMTEIYSVVSNTEDNKELLSEMVRECKCLVSGCNSSKNMVQETLEVCNASIQYNSEIKVKVWLD